MIFKALQQNDIVDIISPGSASSNSETKKIKKFLKKIGLQPRIFLEENFSLKNVLSCDLPAFSNELRFEQLRQAVENAESKIIWCARGGYGTGDLLPLLEKMPKPKKTKIFIGFSDISSLNRILIEKWHWQVINAPMLIQIALDLVSTKSKKAIVDFIFGKKSKLKYSLNSLSKITGRKIEAKITGGCLSVLAGHFGTRNQINWHKKILFLEDEGEGGERLDRYFRQIVDVIIEQKKLPAAIVLGNFLQANPYGRPKAKNIKIAIIKFAQRLAEQNLQIPLFEEKTKCLGHSKNMMPLVLGVTARIDDDNFLIQD